MSVDRQLSQAKSFIRQGRPSLAAQQYLDILDRFPKNQRALTGLAEAIRQPDAQTVEILADELETLRLVYKTGDLQTAFAIGSALLPKASHIPQLRSNLGAIALDLGDTQRASAEFELAAKLDPTQPVGWLNLAAAQLRAERYVEALAAAERALLLAPKNGRAQVVYAQICIAMGKVAEALDILSRYTGTGPEEMEARISLGVAQESAGDKDAALATWAAVLDKYPGSAAALYNYTAIAKATAENNMADQVKEAITKERHAAAPSSSALTHLHFAAAKIHHDLEEYPQAFDNYRLGNLLKREEEGYNSEEDQMRMNFVKSNFPIQNFPQLPSDAIAAPGRPIFIVSLPRSGSTLIEQILSSHSQVTDGGELDTLTHAVRDTGGVTAPITPDRLADIRDRYFSGIQARGISGPVFTDKMPLNFRLIGYIALAIPEASVVHMIRDPRATCWSMYRRLFPRGAAGGSFMYGLEDLAKYHHMYRDLMEFWEARLPGRVYHLEYERLTEQPEAETRKLLEAVGLDFQESCLNFHQNARSVSTASSQQVRQPMYRGSSEEWKHYADYLTEAWGDLKKFEPSQGKDQKTTVKLSA